MSQLPLRKYIKVWTKRRRNNPKKDGSVTTSYTLEWVEYGSALSRTIMASRKPNAYGLPFSRLW